MTSSYDLITPLSPPPSSLLPTPSSLLLLASDRSIFLRMRENLLRHSIMPPPVPLGQVGDEACSAVFVLPSSLNQRTVDVQWYKP